MPIEVGQGESILWQGSRLVKRGPQITLGVLLSVLVLIQLDALWGVPFGNQVALDLLVGSVIVINLLAILMNMSIRFYITNRRIVKTVDFFVLKRTFQLPLQSILEARATQARGGRDTGYVVFFPPQGFVPVVFGPVRGDSERIREVALQARSAATGTPAAALLLTTRSAARLSLRVLVVGIIILLVGGAVWGLGLGTDVAATLGGFLLILGGIVLVATGVAGFSNQRKSSPPPT